MGTTPVVRTCTKHTHTHHRCCTHTLITLPHHHPSTPHTQAFKRCRAAHKTQKRHRKARSTYTCHTFIGGSARNTNEWALPVYTHYIDNLGLLSYMYTLVQIHTHDIHGAHTRRACCCAFLLFFQTHSLVHHHTCSRCITNHTHKYTLSLFTIFHTSLPFPCIITIFRASPPSSYTITTNFTHHHHHHL